ncbi:MAG: response regulator [Proteobacteria bacterium]|nr:response regulator [Pseudomonadota bacterium]MBU1581210.1 response regulator [Pseudomonadota bacterium]MBU2453719.1 response regulator [Pseudomonadota bacterium]MBU2631258.1 response regulator [Pseudomonadota bacterium]
MIREKEKPKVLIIDDEIQMRFYLTALVNAMGFDPILAKDGVQGLDILSHIRPAVIVLDIMMPEMGGARVFQELASHSEFKTIPIVFFSGVDRTAFFHYIKMLNATLKHPVPEPLFFVAKDADPEYLKEVIKTCVMTKPCESDN